MAREGLMDDTGYYGFGFDCPEDESNLEICEGCVNDGDCELQGLIIKEMHDREDLEYGKCE